MADFRAAKTCRERPRTSARTLSGQESRGGNVPQPRSLLAGFPLSGQVLNVKHVKHADGRGRAMVRKGSFLIGAGLALMWWIGLSLDASAKILWFDAVAAVVAFGIGGLVDDSVE